MTSFAFEQEALRSNACRIAGVDEAGRGPLAGPVAAAAVVFPLRWILGGLPPELSGLTDSKALTEKKRGDFFAWITEHEDVKCSVAMISPDEIDRINILQATHQAMRAAVRGLKMAVDHILVDGRYVPGFDVPETPIVKGDAKSFSISAASVLAKVTRDRLMVALDQRYPGYGFAHHKGYGTKAHLEAIDRLGPCPIHRRSFAPLKSRQRELSV